MKKVKVQDAVGLTLCHDITAMRDGFKGAAFKRGHVIEGGDVEKLLDLGKRTVFIWEENAGEIHEEDAARRMAAMAQVEGCHYTEPSEGKVLLMADTRGMFRVDTALLNQVNSIGDLTISTLPDHFPVEAGDRLASMRIVPLVTQEAQILEAERLCQGKKLLDLRPYRVRRAGVIITGSEIYTGRIKDKFEPVVRAKLAHYPGEILGVTGLLDSGRTELALSLFGIRPAQSGEIRIHGKPTVIKSPRAAIENGIGFVPEDRLSEGLFLSQSIADNIVISEIDDLTKKGLVDAQKTNEEIDCWVKELAIATPNPANAASTLSGGNQQRIVLAKWLACRPQILVLNGPTVGVDIGSKHDIHAILQSLAGKGMAVIIISDDLPELLENCSRIMILKDGRIVDELTADEASEKQILSKML